MSLRSRQFSRIPARELIALLLLGAIFWTSGAGAAVSTHRVNVPNATPVVSAVTLNNGSAITLTPNTTTTVRVNFTVSDDNGCGNVFFGGNVTTSVFRSGTTLGSSCGPLSTLFCYVISTSTHSCPSDITSQTSANATATIDIYYFAQATDASSSFAVENWSAVVAVRDASSSNNFAASGAVELNTLVALELASTSLNYGSMSPGTNTSGTNQTATVKNAGNASTSLDVSGTALTNGSRSIPTSSQHYATSTFTFGGLEQVLSATAQAVSGFLIPRPPLARWVSTTPLPSPRQNHVAVSNNGFLYNLGGSVDDFNNEATGTVLFAPINATGSIGAWTLGTFMPVGRTEHSAVVYSDFMYVLGGVAFLTTSSGQTTSSVIFAPINATGSIGAWTRTTAMPSFLKDHVSAASNGFIYVIGGNSIFRTSTVLFAPINATGSIGAWTNATPLPAAVDRHAATISNGFIYVLGGSTSGGSTSTVLRAPINATGSLGAWTLATALPQSADSNTVVESNDTTYLPLGVANSGQTSTVLFSPVNSGSLGPWSNTASLPGLGSYNFSAVANNGYIYHSGGYAESSITSTVHFASLASRNTYWGLDAPAGYPTGTYSGTVTYTAVFQP